jgi:hypothetical protein
MIEMNKKKYQILFKDLNFFIAFKLLLMASRALFWSMLASRHRTTVPMLASGFLSGSMAS